MLASPIVQYVATRAAGKTLREQLISETATFHLVGPSGTGKTVLAMIAASVSGGLRQLSMWDFTRAGLEEYLESRNEVGAIFDDQERFTGEHMSFRQAIKTVTQYVAGGRSKQISKIAEAIGLTQKYWQTFGLSSGPIPDNNHLNKARTDGEEVRFFLLIIPTGEEGGIIDEAPPGVDRQTFGKKIVRIYERVSSTYGHLMPAWIRVLLAEDWSEKIFELRDKFVDAVAANGSGYDVRFARKFGVLYAVGCDSK